HPTPPLFPYTTLFRSRPHQSRNPPPSRAVAPQQSAQNRASERAPLFHARHSNRLLRRRDRHGRQHLPRRSQRLSNADAIEPLPRSEEHTSELQSPYDL